MESNPSSITLPSIDFHRHFSFPITTAIRIGQEFDGFKSFKIAIQDWALPDPRKFTFRFKKSDRKCNTVVRVHANTGCPSEVNATYPVVKECVTAVCLRKDTIAWA